MAHRAKGACECRRGVTGAYPYVEAESGGIPGGISSRIPVKKGGAVLVVEVDDVAATMDRAVRLGGRKRFPEEGPEHMSLTGDNGSDVSFEFEEFEDPEGNLIGIIQR